MGDILDFFVNDLSTNGTVRETLTITATDTHGNSVTANLSEVVSEYITAGTTFHMLGKIDCTPPTFTVEYFSDNGLTNSITDNSKLKAGTYYIKVESNEILSEAPSISINSEGTENDITNAFTTLVAGNVYKYTRTITGVTPVNGTTAEVITITGSDDPGNIATNVTPTTHGNVAIYIDTKPAVVTPVTIASSNSNTTLAKLGNQITITLTADEPLTPEAPATAITVNSLTIWRYTLYWCCSNNYKYIRQYLDSLLIQLWQATPTAWLHST